MLEKILNAAICTALVCLLNSANALTRTNPVGDTEYFHNTIRVSEDGTARAEVEQFRRSKESNFKAREGVPFFNELLFFRKSLESVEILKAEYVLTDGTRVPLEPANIEQFMLANGPLGVKVDEKVLELIKDQWLCRVVFEKKDNVAGYYFHYVHTFRSFLPGYFSWEQILDHPQGKHGDTRYTLIAPSSMKLWFGNRQPDQFHQAGDSQIAEWRYSNDMDSLATTFVSFPSANTKQYVLFQVANSSSTEFMKRFDQYFSARDASEMASMELLANQITTAAAANSDSEKIEAVYQWVKENLTYGEQVWARDGTTPLQPSALLQQKTGDCKDYVWLTISLLRSIGIQAYPVMLNTDARNAVSLNTARHRFDHIIVYIPLLDAFIDPTSKKERSADSTLPLAGLTAICGDGKMRTIFNKKTDNVSQGTN